MKARVAEPAPRSWPEENQVWLAVGKAVVRRPASVLMASLVMLSPFALIACNSSSYSALPSQIIPDATPAGQALHELQQAFGSGRVWPYYLLVQARGVSSGAAPLLNADFFLNAQQVLQEMVANVPNTPRTNITGIVFANGQPVPFELLAMAYDESLPIYASPTGHHMRQMAQHFVSPAGDATFLYVTFGIDPFGPRAKAWLHDARRFLEAVSQSSQYTWQVAGSAAEVLDLQDAVMERFPLIVAVTAACLIGLLGYAFGSLVVPLRSVLTTALTLGFVYGALQVVQGGVPLRFLFINIAAPWAQPGVAWLAPVMTFTVLVGLNTDYDVFLVSSVRQLRVKGHSNDEAIVLGLHAHGGVITTAGLVMAFAFAGLLPSSTVVVRQVAFVIVVAVLFDTFIVRSLLVPALMSVLGELSWWPSVMPPVTYHSFFSRSGRFNAGAGAKRAMASLDENAASHHNQRPAASELL